MVTVETTKDILFALENCVLSNFIELVSKLLPLPPKVIRLKKPNKEILKYSPTKTFPILKAGDDFISGTLPIVKYLIKSAKDDSDGVILDNRKILIGKNLKEEAKVDMWLNFIFSKIYPIVKEIEMQLYGKKKFDIRYFESSLNDLLEILVEINQYLELKPFLTANHVQLCDIMLGSVLFNCYNDIFTQNELNLIPNVIRVFKFVANMRLFKKVFGKAIPCKKIKKHEPYIEKKNVEKEGNEGTDKSKENKKGKKKNKEN